MKKPFRCIPIHTTAATLRTESKRSTFFSMHLPVVTPCPYSATLGRKQHGMHGKPDHKSQKFLYISRPHNHQYLMTHRVALRDLLFFSMIEQVKVKQVFKPSKEVAVYKREATETYPSYTGSLERAHKESCLSSRPLLGPNIGILTAVAKPSKLVIG